MRLAVPSIGVPVDEMAVSESYSDLPEDGLDGAWEIPCQEEVAETITIPSMDDGMRLIGAPADRTEPEQYQVEGDAPLVMFSFGPAKVSEGGWTVCFSF